MKKSKIMTIATISFALILVGSVTYAAERKKQAKLRILPPEKISEEEALKAELLAATEEYPKTVPDAPATKKGAERTLTQEDQLKG